MFENERQAIDSKIHEILISNAIPVAEFKWTPIPFSGEWGISTSFFATAAGEARSEKKVVVAERAQELAELIGSQLHGMEGISRIEAVQGDLHLYFPTSDDARRVVGGVPH